MKRVFLVCALFAVTACGVEGPAGPPGESGVGLVETFNCTGAASLGNAHLNFDYDRYTFADGSVLLNCAIRDAASIYSNNFLFKDDQVGATNGNCAVVYDVDAATSGYWTFESPNNVATATYSDSGSPFNGTRISLTCAMH